MSYSKPKTVGQIKAEREFAREESNSSIGKALLVFCLFGAILTGACKYGNRLRQERLTEKKETKTEATAKTNATLAPSMK